MLIISANDQKKVLDMKELINAMGVALSEYSAARTVTPIRSALPVTKAGATTLTMPAVAEAINALGVKIVSVFPHNHTLGKQTINGVMLVLDVETGEPLALLEGSCLTVLRTGALSGLATKYLSRTDSAVLCVIGTGAQARGLVDAVMAVRPIRAIRLFNRTEAKARSFAQELAEQHCASTLSQVTVCDKADKAADGADIVVTATNAETPVFSPEAIKPGAHLNAVGSFRPSMQEIPTDVLVNASKVVVEAREAALEETGDLRIPIEQGAFKPEHLYAELGEIVSGTRKGRESDEEITVFKSVGLAAADIVAAKLLYEKAVRAGLGQKVTL